MGENAYRRLLEILDRGEGAVLASVHPGGDGATRRLCLSATELKPGAEASSLDRALFDECRSALDDGALRWSPGEAGSWRLIEPFDPEPRLVILGGGHVALPLVELGSMMGFRVTVCDDRPSFANQARFPKAERVICEYFGTFLDRHALNPSTYVAILTRGHRHDMECYRRLARRDLAYIGMIGSRRRIAELRAAMLEEGIPEAELARLHAPIGLDIGAVTPGEIALAIMAEVVAARRTKGAEGEKRRSCAELDRGVLEELRRETPEPRALLTVVGAKGSTPRGIGAKMVAWPDGRTLGSIGGGCGEGAAIVAARDAIRDGGARVFRVDLTGAIAEDEGMACGGVMDVLIEAIE